METRLKRRSLVKGVAWATPIIMAASTAPSFAVSPVKVIGRLCGFFYGSGGINAQRQQINLSLKIDEGTTYIPAGTVLTWHFSADQELGSPANTFSQSDDAFGQIGGGSPAWTLRVLDDNDQILAPGTSVTSFKVTLTIEVDTEVDPANPPCFNALNWDGSASANSANVTPGTIMTMTAENSAYNADSGSISWRVPRRKSTSQVLPIATKFISRSGAQGCWPTVRYSYMSGHRAQYGSQGSTCGDGANNTSTLYPDGQCRKLWLQPGHQDDVVYCG